MQSTAKTKKEFDAALFQEQLHRLPRNVQRHFIMPSFWERSPKKLKLNKQVIDTETAQIDYRLIPALFSFDCVQEFSHVIQEIKRLRECKHFTPKSKIQLYHFEAGGAYGIWSTYAKFNLFDDTKFIRDNPNEFLIIGSAYKAEIYIHESHIKRIENLTVEQLNFILDLFDAQFNLNKTTKLDYRWSKPKIILNEAQARLFYSIPQDIQRNLKMNYRLAASTKTQLLAKAPRVSAGLSRLSRTYTQYDHKPLVQLAKIAMKAGLVYYGLKWAASSKMLQGRNETLLKLLSHRKKFILGTAALIGAKDAYSPSVTQYVNRTVPAIGRLARKASDFLTPPLM